MLIDIATTCYVARQAYEDNTLVYGPLRYIDTE